MNNLRSHICSLRDRLMHPLMRAGRSEYAIHAPYKILGSPGYHSFIGYYDIQPFNKDGTKLLAGRCPSSHNGRAMDMPLEIGYFDLADETFIPIGTTQLWCWQMGCRLQWIEWQGKEIILYNDMGANAPQTMLYDPDAGQISASWDYPAYCLSGDAKYMISLDFNNLERCRGGYGYDWNPNGSRHNEAGLMLYNTGTKECSTLITTQQLRDVHGRDSMDERGVFHYFNHIHFNPSATRILCFHIWNIARKRHVRALTMNLDGSDIRDVTNSDHVSHYWWLNDDHILLYGTDPKHGIGYHIYDQSGGHIKALNADIPKLDGHPRSSQAPWFVSDTVVNKRFERELWMYNTDTKTRTDLASFYSPPRFSGPTRCDLHPRLSQDGSLIAVDSAHAGYRQIVLLDLQGI